MWAEYHKNVYAIEDRGIRYNARVEDVRIRFGHVDCLMKPVSGTGERWVQASTLGSALSALSY